MLQSIRLLSVFLCVSSLFLVSEGQLFDTRAASLGGAPVGFISRFGGLGDQESYASLGNAPVGVYQRRQYPQRYQVYRIPSVQVYPPARPPVVHPPVKPPCRLPGPCGQVVKPIRPVKPPCRLPGPCGQVVKPIRPVRPPYKPVVRPPVRPVVRPPMRPVVRPPVRPVRPHKRPRPSYVTRKPYVPGPKAGGVEGRSGGGLLGGLIPGFLSGLGR